MIALPLWLAEFPIVRTLLLLGAIAVLWGTVFAILFRNRRG